ncbi:MAG: NADH:ubiquinone reductase (Na(+)-transporting) subunit A [Pseudaminobacter sp.]
MKTGNPTRLDVRKGLDLRLPGKPRQAVRKAGTVTSVAISGHDFPDTRPDFTVKPGDRVRAGQTVFVDRRRPRIAFTAPAAGRVVAINRGQRRSLDSLVIRREGDAAESFPVPSSSGSTEEIRGLLLKSGLWPSFLTRPFGRIPDPDAVPDAIFVTAIDTNPLAADPRVAIGLHQEEFRYGLAVLPLLTPGPVFVCRAPGQALVEEAPGRIKDVVFCGLHPAGLAGTHIHHLAPVANGRSVWQIGYQHVIAIGHLLETGHLPAERIVAIAGPGVQDPSLVRLPNGASLDEALDGELADGPVRIISGPALTGREAGYLGRYHNQVTVIARDQETLTAQGLVFRLRSFFTGVPDAAIIPREAFERVLPLDILPVPLLRALSIGDVETARALGCLELVEEDLALLSHVCTTGTDYGALLRNVLNQIEAEG